MLFRFTNNILSTAQQIWLQKLGGAKNPVKEFNDNADKKEQQKMQISASDVVLKENRTKAREQQTSSEGLRPGERLSSYWFYERSVILLKD